jgi:hypothetical protein
MVLFIALGIIADGMSLSSSSESEQSRASKEVRFLARKSIVQATDREMTSSIWDALLHDKIYRKSI